MTETPDTTPEPTTNTPGGENTVAEAKKYRQRAQAAEAERDELRARLDTLQRAEVERIAADTLADPADLWTTGTTITDYLTEEGNIDNDKITTTITELVRAKPHWQKPQPTVPNASEVRGDDEIKGGDPTPTFTDAFKPKNQR